MRDTMAPVVPPTTSQIGMRNLMVLTDRPGHGLSPLLCQYCITCNVASALPHLSAKAEHPVVCIHPLLQGLQQARRHTVRHLAPVKPEPYPN